ncbi:MAG: Prolyl oligopeptidase family protein [Gemmataceae bacterium]|nr:Prolyl oligopeptidase family protein [Gemmataceae bacterium]
MNRREMLHLSAAAIAGGLTPPGPPGMLHAADAKVSPDEMIHKYLAAEVERISKNVLDGAESKDEWEKKRPLLKQQFLDMLGLNPLPEKTDLKATVTGTLDRGEVAIENVHYQSRPGLYVTGNLYRPKVNNKKLPAVLYVCGHAGRGRDGNKAAYQDHGLWFASNGYVCLVVDTLQLGEVAGKHHGTYNLDRFWWHSRGYTPAGVECWNGIRGIDYLCSRPEVDPEKIGVTGISGGGATTVWVAAADDRVKVAVPVSGMSDLESYVTNKVINGHCDCMFAYNTYQWEWTTILALFAPKPLLFANSDDDGIFPMDGNRRIIARLRQAYEMLGAKDKMDEYVSKGGHAYRPDLRVAVFGWFHKHLKGDAGAVKDAEDPMIPGKNLRVFPEDVDLPKDAINATADEVFVQKAEVKLPAGPKEFPEWKAGLVKQLREKVFRYLPPATAMLEGHAGPGADEALPDAFRPDRGTEFAEYRPERGLWFPAYIRSKNGDKQIALVVLNPAEDHRKEAEFWMKHHPNDSQIVIYPRGSGPNRWPRKNPPNTVERSLALIGQTADSGRVWDVFAASAMRLGGRLRAVGRGQAGVIGAYAALFAKAKTGNNLIDEVVILDPPTSHRDGPHFLNVMRVLDIPEALGLLAPNVKLTLIGEKAKDKAFDRTAAIYKLAGAEDKFKRE